MGEVNALHPSDIDLEKKTISVHGTISTAASIPEYSPMTKTDAGTRKVPIVNELLPVLKKALDNYKPNKEHLLFYNFSMDRPFATQQVNSQLYTLCHQAGIRRISTHALRHTFATRCYEKNIKPIVVKEWMGHADERVTLSTYTHVTKEMREEAIEQINN